MDPPTDDTVEFVPVRDSDRTQPAVLTPPGADVAAGAARQNEELQAEIRELRSEVELLRERLDRTDQTLDEIRRDLGM